MSYSKLLKRLTIKVLLVLFLISTNLTAQDSSSKENSNDTVFVMQKSPWGAVLRSAVIPGWGQFYNESYLKIPVIWGIGAALAAGWIYNNNRYQDNRNFYIQTNNNLYKQQRDFYRDQRDNFTIYLAILYLLNMVDAYVDAHLFDFTVEDDFINQSAKLEVKFHF